ncbi:MAG: PD-(D/E)XK nuclease domain-containing protein [Muribaculaceae bacterium]
MIYIIFTLAGYYVDVEVHTSKGCVDMAMHTAYALYLIELKIKASAAGRSAKSTSVAIRAFCPA